MVIKFLAKISKFTALIALVFACLYPMKSFSQCTPSSAKICVASDDWSQVYVGGVYLGQVAYCNWDGTGSCPPGCITVPTSLLTGSQVFVSVYTQNTACNNMYSSWDTGYHLFQRTTF